MLQILKGMGLLYLFGMFLGGTLMMFRPYLHYISLFYGIAVLSSQGILMAWKFLKVLKIEQERCCEVILFTENGHGKRGLLTTAVVNDFMQEYPPFRIKPNADCHDRLIVLDYGLPTEQAYHCGASSKDAGKKLCAINVIIETNMIHPVIDKLLLAPDKQI